MKHDQATRGRRSLLENADLRLLHSKRCLWCPGKPGGARDITEHACDQRAKIEELPRGIRPHFYGCEQTCKPVVV